MNIRGFVLGIAPVRRRLNHTLFGSFPVDPALANLPDPKQTLRGGGGRPKALHTALLKPHTVAFTAISPDRPRIAPFAATALVRLMRSKPSPQILPAGPRSPFLPEASSAVCSLARQDAREHDQAQ